VGASWGFIRRPFIWRFIGIGLIAAFLACIILAGMVYAANNYEPGLLTLITWREMAVTVVAVFLFGILITALCSYISVNRFLKMTAGELYKI
jgi:cell division transport system permease protein